MGQDILHGRRRCVGVLLSSDCEFSAEFLGVVYDLDFSGVGVWNGFVDMFSHFVDDRLS